MNDQRKVIFGQRREIMEAADLSDVILDMRHQVIDDLVDEYMPPKSYADQWDIEGLYADCFATLALTCRWLPGPMKKASTTRLYRASL